MRLIPAILIVSLLFTSCSHRYTYKKYSDYTFSDEENRCVPVHHEYRSNLKVNLKKKIIRASIFGEEQYFKIESYDYNYKPFSFFPGRKDRESLEVKCENGYRFIIVFNRYAKLFMTDDGDDDECDDVIFYDLI